MRSFILIFMVFVSSRCGHKVGDESRDFAIYYKSDSGQDLLNPNTNNHFAESEIKIYDVVELNGLTTKKLGATSFSNTSASTFLFKDETGVYYLKYVLRPVTQGADYSNYANGVMINSTQIQLSPTITDTLRYSHRFEAIPNPLPDTIFYLKKPIFILQHPNSANAYYSNNTYKITLVR